MAGNRNSLIVVSWGRAPELFLDSRDTGQRLVLTVVHRLDARTRIVVTMTTALGRGVRNAPRLAECRDARSRCECQNDGEQGDAKHKARALT